MNIILVSGKFSKAHSLTLTAVHLAVAVTLLLCMVAVAAYGLQSFMARRAAAPAEGPGYVRENINALAARLGQMQAADLPQSVAAMGINKAGGVTLFYADPKLDHSDDVLKILGINK